MPTAPKSARRRVALTFQVPGELGAVLRELGYEARLVVRRAGGKDLRPAEPEALARVMLAAENADAAGRACGVNLRAELAALSIATGPATHPRTPTASPRTAVHTP